MPLPGSSAARTAGAVLQHRGRLRRPGRGARCEEGAAGGCPASDTSRVGGTSEPDRRWQKEPEERTSAAIYEEKWRGQVQLRIPAIGGDPRAGGKGRKPGVASPPPRLRRAPLRLFPARQPHPALTASCRGDGILWRRRREAPGIGPGPLPALAPAGGRALGYPCAVTVFRDRSFVWPSSHSDLEKDLHSIPSFLAEYRKSLRLDRSNMLL